MTSLILNDYFTNLVRMQSSLYQHTGGEVEMVYLNLETICITRTLHYYFILVDRC